MGRYSPLPKRLLKLLNRIEPSAGGELPYFPCRVLLRDGTALDTVYIEPEKPYLKYWGVYPEDDEGKESILIDDVVEIEESPMRLPVRWANVVYAGGESGMGYHVFTIIFSDGSRQAYGSGNAIDFISYPPGKGPQDIVGVMPHEGRQASSRMVCLPWYWCLYSGVED